MANVGKYTIPWVYGYTVHIFQGLPFFPQATVAIAWDVTALAVGPVTASVMVITCHFHFDKWRTGVAGGWEAWDPQLQSFGTRNSNQLPRRHFCPPWSYPNFGKELWKGKWDPFHGKVRLVKYFRIWQGQIS